MSFNKEASIWLALKSRLKTLLPNVPKAYPAETFRPPQNGTLLSPYLRIGRVSTDPVRMLIDDGKPHWRTGSLMVTLVYPLGQPGVEIYDQIAGSIALHFKDGTNMRYGDVCVTVTSYPHVQEGYEDSGYWTVPVRIPWRCFV